MFFSNFRVYSIIILSFALFSCNNLNHLESGKFYNFNGIGSVTRFSQLDNKVNINIDSKVGVGDITIYLTKFNPLVKNIKIRININNLEAISIYNNTINFYGSDDGIGKQYDLNDNLSTPQNVDFKIKKDSKKKYVEFEIPKIFFDYRQDIKISWVDKIN